MFVCRWKQDSSSKQDTLNNFQSLDQTQDDLDDLESVDGAIGMIELGDLIDSFEPSYSSTEIELRETDTQSFRSGTDSPSKADIYPVANSGRRVHRTTEQRRRDLEADPRTSIVDPDQILCALCNKWIQLRKDVSYSAQNWLKHAGICEQRHKYVN